MLKQITVCFLLIASYSYAHTNVVKELIVLSPDSRNYLSLSLQAVETLASKSLEIIWKKRELENTAYIESYIQKEKTKRLGSRDITFQEAQNEITNNVQKHLNFYPSTYAAKYENSLKSLFNIVNMARINKTDNIKLSFSEAQMLLELISDGIKEKGLDNEPRNENGPDSRRNRSL